MRRTWGALLLLVAASGTASASLAGSTAPPTPTVLDADHSIDRTDTRPRIETTVVVDPADPRHLVVSAIQLQQSMARGWVDGALPYNAVWSSRDGGATFSPGQPLPAQPGGVPSGDDPGLAWGSGETVYAAYTSWSGHGTANVPADGLYVARSPDAGRTWQRGAHLEGYACGGPDRSTAAVDRARNRLFVVWVHYDEGSACNGTPDLALTRTRWAVSSDGGRHFSRPVDVTTAGESNQPAPAVLPDGTLLVAYLKQYRNDPTDETCHGLTGSVGVAHYAANGALLGRSTALQHLCSATAGVSPNGATYLPILFPAIAVDPTTRHVVVATLDDEPTRHGIAVATSTGGSGTWSQTFVGGLPETTASMVAAAAGPHGGLALGWLQVDAGGLYSPVLSGSWDGSAWSAPLAVASQPSLGDSHPYSQLDPLAFGHYLGLAVGPDKVAVMTWPDLRPHAGQPTDSDIWIRRVRL